jgi:hypothetical protein
MGKAERAPIAEARPSNASLGELPSCLRLERPVLLRRQTTRFLFLLTTFSHKPPDVFVSSVFV